MSLGVYCDLISPIRWSKNDTVETVRQAQAYNRTHRELCNAPSKG